MTGSATAGSTATEIPGRQLLLLLLVADDAEASFEKFPLDRVRLQKAGFLLSMRGPGRWHGFYPYRPYDWGPYSDDLTADVRDLRLHHLVTLKPGHGRYDTHTTTSYGQRVAAACWTQLDDLERDFARKVRAYVTNRTFNELLTEIYAAYPQFAVKSKFSDKEAP